MEITTLAKTKEYTLPLPMYESIRVANAHSKDGTQFSVFVGLSEEHVRQLKGNSLNEADEAIQQLTSDRKRFGEGSYKKWYEKGRVPFALIDQETDSLAALIWLGFSPLKGDSENWHTIAYRSYAPFRGKGIMKSFGRFVVDFYTAYYPKVKIWAGIHAENESSAGLAGALGFVESKERSDQNSGEIIMIKK